MAGDAKKSNSKNPDAKKLDINTLPKPVVAGVAVLVLAGSAFGVYHAMNPPDAYSPQSTPSSPGPGSPGGPGMLPSGVPSPGGAPTPPGAPLPVGTAPAAGAPHEVEALRAHLQQHPDIARVDYQTTNVASVDVTLRAGISDAQAVEVAKRIRQYMTAAYPNIGDGGIVEIMIHRRAFDESHLRVEQQIDEKAGTHAWHVIQSAITGPQVLE